ncbi:MAG: HAD hydrolase-like protein [bacterium]
MTRIKNGSSLEYHLFFDCDDTLWEEQAILQRAEKEIEKSIDNHLGIESNFQKRFIQTEIENIGSVGFGFSSYFFSLSEAFFSVYAGDLILKKIFLQKIGKLIKTVNEFKPPLIDGVKEVLTELLRRGYSLHIITRGASPEQKEKLKNCQIKDMFTTINVVDSKTSQIYRGLLERYSLHPLNACMIGNSVKSDILPSLDAGMGSILIPSDVTWGYDNENLDVKNDRFLRLNSFKELLNHFDGTSII